MKTAVLVKANHGTLVFKLTFCINDKKTQRKNKRDLETVKPEAITTDLRSKGVIPQYRNGTSNIGLH